MKQTLFTPGPVELSESVLNALAEPPLYHKSAAFEELWTRTCAAISTIAKTTRPALLIPGAGTAAAELAMRNVHKSSDRILVLVNGRFSQRWARMSDQFGYHTEYVESEWGSGFNINRIENIVEALQPDAIWITHVETSTGVRAELQQLCERIKRSSSALVCVDAISSLGIEEFSMDAWEIDVTVCSSNKGLAAPPGIGILLCSDRAMERVGSACANTYFDLPAIVEQSGKGRSLYTPPVQTVRALHASCQMILGTGLTARINRLAQQAQYVRQCAAHTDIATFGVGNSNGLTVLRLPHAERIRKTLEVEHGYILAEGQDNLRDKVLRFGHMTEFGTNLIDALFTELQGLLRAPRVK